MAKYKWSFETEVGGVKTLTECKPIIEDSTSLDFAKESNQQFYRAKLNGSLSFRFEYDYILNAGYNAVHIVVLQRYDEDLSDFVEVWRGSFTLTDCEVDVDTRTISVKPETNDRYRKILDHLQDEYNLLKINPTQQGVDMQIRPIIQVYCDGASKITNITSNGYYEMDCEPHSIFDEIIHNNYNPYHFAIPYDSNLDWYMPSAVCTLWLQDSITHENLYFFAYFEGSTTQNTTRINDAVLYKYNPDTGVKTIISNTIQAELEYRYNDIRDYFVYFDWLDNNVSFILHYEDKEANADVPYAYHIPTGWDFIKARFNMFVVRALLYTDATSITIGGATVPTYDLDITDDIAPVANYNKVAAIYSLADFYCEAEFQVAVTDLTLADQGGYFKELTSQPPFWYRPINLSGWCLHAMYATSQYYADLEAYNKTKNIRHCYTLTSVILQLISKADANITLGTSDFLNSADNHISENAFSLLITPRTNISSSYYDQPAQNAPISLEKVFNMLRGIYQVYWYIDENNEIHFEHISFFENGMDYNEQVNVLVDLETEIHTRTTKYKAFGQNKYKFDKGDMPRIIKFSFDDTQTIPFDGYQIECTDAFVQQDSTNEQTIGGFDTDVDYIIANPENVSKEGFVLLACPYEGGQPNYALKVKKNIKAKDENGVLYRYNIQNYDAAMIYVQKFWWRYALPCENIKVNNEETNALSTGNFKNQTVEFADVAVAELIADTTNCIKTITTQQGNGHIKSLSVNLNSLASKGDLLFNFIGRFYYLRGTALGASITIVVNNEPKTISVSDNSFKYRYTEPISALSFAGTDVVSVDFADCDRLENLTSCDNMFLGCDELLAVDFAGKAFGAVTSATDMFDGCTSLTTLICPSTASWKADLDFSDCPNLTLDSLNDLINDFLYVYDSGVHTITPNSTFWNSLDGDTQTDIMNRATAKGWQIGMPARYTLSGTSLSNTVYATINGNAVEIAVSGGAWQYDYNTEITSISFANDTNVETIDFSLSDGLANVTSLASAFSGCTSLVSVDFTDCDLSAMVGAASAFSGCTDLLNIVLPSNSWQPDIDLSDTAIPYSNMSGIVAGLYTYSSGTHTITFNSTIWDALSVAQQQTIFDAAQLKWWTTNAVTVIYYIRGTSSNVNGTETFNIQFIDDGALSPSPSETLTIAVDGNGDFEYSYQNKKLVAFSLSATNTTLQSLDMSESDGLSELLTAYGIFAHAETMVSANFKHCTFDKCTSTYGMFSSALALTSVDFSDAIFGEVTTTYGMFQYTSITSVSFPKATFAKCTNFGIAINSSLKTIDLAEATFEAAINWTTVDNGFFGAMPNVETLLLPKATFANATNIASLFREKPKLTALSLPMATFANADSARQMFQGCGINGIIIDMPLATFAKCTNAFRMFNRYNRTYGNIAQIKMPSATFDLLPSGTSQNGSIEMFGQNSNLVVLDVPNSQTFNATLDLRNSTALPYSEMLKAANWLYDLSGGTAKTITYSATAWNALSSAEQNNIDSILSGKNWNRAIA